MLNVADHQLQIKNHINKAVKHYNKKVFDGKPAIKEELFEIKTAVNGLMEFDLNFVSKDNETEKYPVKFVFNPKNRQIEYAQLPQQLCHLEKDINKLAVKVQRGLRLDDALGWYGMVAIVSAYIVISFGFVTSNNLFYQLLNLTGSLGIAYISFKKKTYQPGVLNIIWMIVAVIVIGKMLVQ